MAALGCAGYSSNFEPYEVLRCASRIAVGRWPRLRRGHRPAQPGQCRLPLGKGHAWAEALPNKRRSKTIPLFDF